MAGWVSVLGVQAGNVVHIAVAKLGLTAIFAAMPWVFDLIRFAGAAYVPWLAWQAINPGGRGGVLQQGLQLAATHIGLSIVVNGLTGVGAEQLARLFARRAAWMRCQRYLMAGVLAGLAARLLAIDRK